MLRVKNSAEKFLEKSEAIPHSRPIGVKTFSPPRPPKNSCAPRFRQDFSGLWTGWTHVTHGEYFYWQIFVVEYIILASILAASSPPIVKLFILESRHYKTSLCLPQREGSSVAFLNETPARILSKSLLSARYKELS